MAYGNKKNNEVISCDKYGKNYTLITGFEDDYTIKVYACCDRELFYNDYKSKESIYNNEYCHIEKTTNFIDRYDYKDHIHFLNFDYSDIVSFFEIISLIAVMIAVILTWIFSILWWIKKDIKKYRCYCVFYALYVSLLFGALSYGFENINSNDTILVVTFATLIFYIIFTFIAFIINNIIKKKIKKRNKKHS